MALVAGLCGPAASYPAGGRKGGEVTVVGRNLPSEDQRTLADLPHVYAASYRTTAVPKMRRGDGKLSDFRPVVLPLSLALLTYPALALVAPAWADTFFAAIAIALAPFILGRIHRVGWPAIWLILLFLVYVLSSQFGENPAQGFTHSIALGCLGITFLTFATYGHDIVNYRWMRSAVILILAIDIVAVLTSSLSKNATGGVLIYLIGLAVVVLLRQSSSHGWLAAFSFAGIGVAIALQLNFRFLVACSLIFLLSYFVATHVSALWYFAFGVTLSAATIALVIWFFLNINRGGLAWEIGQFVTQLSGHRATSGRERLWLSIINTASEHQLFGLGAGILPRDIFSTELSSHSYYLQVYLQVGALGLLLLTCFLLSVWTVLCRARTATGRFGSAAFLMFVVHNSMEVLMLQNSSIVALPAWALVGLAIASEHARRGQVGRG